MSAANHTQFVEHVVLFKIKPDVDPATVAVMVNNLQRLGSIDTVIHLGAGPLVRFRSSSSSLDFTHIIHIRFACKADLDAFAVHPTHLDVVKYNKPNIEDVMAMDWVHSADSVTIPSGSAMRVTFLKLKENLEEKHKNELIGVVEGMKEKFPVVELLSCGENFVPGRDKGFSIASIAVFKGSKELDTFHSDWEAAADEQKDLLNEKVDDSLVLDFVIP